MVACLLAHAPSPCATRASLKVLFTNVEVTVEGKKCLAAIGAVAVDDVAAATHVVAAALKEGRPFKRSTKVMAAISLTPYILDMAWLVESAAAGMGVALAEGPYVIRDPAVEAK